MGRGYDKTLTSAWKKLWPVSVDDCNEEVLGNEVISEITSLAIKMGLEVSADDITELVEEHAQELTTEQLIEMHQFAREESPELPIESNQVPMSGDIKEMLTAWELFENFIEKHQPKKIVAKRAIDLFNDNAVSGFRKTLKTKEKQQKISTFFKAIE